MEHMNMLKTFAMSGGDWVIYFLIACSVLAMAVILERAFIILRQSRYLTMTLRQIESQLKLSELNELLKKLEPNSILYRTLHALLEHSFEGFYTLDQRLATRLSLERRKLEKRILILGTLGNNAPFIGLLGTVLGVIRAFHDLAASGGQGPEVVMMGISEALVATAVGILVALPCVAFYNFIQKRVDDLLQDVELFGKTVIGLIQTGSEPAQTGKR